MHYIKIISQAYIINTYLVVLIGCTMFMGCRMPNVKEINDVHVPTVRTESTKDRQITLQKRQTWSFQNSTIHFSNEFLGARLCDVKQTGPAEFTLLSAAENEPINDSAWYAFKVWTTAEEEGGILTLEIIYQGGTHRYHPKISRNQQTWKGLPPADVAIHPDNSSAIMRVSVDKKPTWIAAQELITEQYYQNWLKMMSRNPFITHETVGFSAQGRAITRMDIASGTEQKAALVILGRQHPPEATGALALFHFVKAISADTPLAVKFRKNIKIVVFPFINPDGVAEGHWRHNSQGIDLNRDWKIFNQQEPRVVRDSLAQLPEKTPIIYAVDFHSTYNDIFYVIEKRLDRRTYDKSLAWIKALSQRLPDYAYQVQQVSSEVSASSVWLYNTYKIPAVTYEVGDGTDRNKLKKISNAAAQTLMKILLDSMK